MNLRKILQLKKLTDNKWINLFFVKYINAKLNTVEWTFVSRKEHPIADPSVDAVVIAPIVDTPTGRRLVITKEYRVAIGGCEYGFPAGLIEEGQDIAETAIKELKEETGLDITEITDVSCPIYSSPGICDESCVIVFAKAAGEISYTDQEDSEDIEVLFYDIDDINKLLGSGKKVGAKAWGILYYYSKIGKIE
ncbi:MAG: NUDIX hydrolase [Candidatus Asgardarchaeia archaeon]